jgi:hypothetical protein
MIPSEPPTEPVPTAAVTAASPPGPPGAKRTPVVAIVAAVVALIGGIVLGAVLFGGDDGDDVASDETTTTGDDTTTTTDDESTTTESSPTTQPTGADIPPPTTIDARGLDGEALELAEMINNAYTLRYHAVYEGALQGSGGGETEVRLEIWRDPPTRARRDTDITGPQGLVTREIRRPENVYGCLTPDRTEYVCTRGRGSVDPADPVFGALDPREGAVVGAPTEEGADRCFTVQTLESDQLICFDDDGIPMIIDTPDGRLTRVSVDENIADDTFDLPAPPSGDIESTTTTVS